MTGRLRVIDTAGGAMLMAVPCTLAPAFTNRLLGRTPSRKALADGFLGPYLHR